MNRGVPQGSKLGLLLFALFINDLPNCLSVDSYHLYADDFQFWFSFDPQSFKQAIDLVNNNLSLINSWAKLNELSLNPKKSLAIVIHKARQKIHRLPPISLNGEIIPYVDHTRNLGLVINSHLDWSDHVAKICQLVNFTLRSLRVFGRLVPQDTRLLLVKALIIPHFSYCDVVFSNDINVASRQRLSVTFNNYIRYIYSLLPWDHVSRIS